MKQGFRRIKTKLWVVSFVGLYLFLGVPSVKAFQLSDKAEISLITCAPGNGAATVYGHSAIRVKDLANNYDTVFNYGIYDFDAPNFLYRFASGETDYILDTAGTNYFVRVYKYYKRSVYEQVLNLTTEEKQKIVDFLIWNAKPENRVYRYNFFFDNCATRVRDVIADNVEGGITFNEEKHSHKTLRQLVEDYHGKLLWLTFGIDLAVSSESDREASYWEEMLLPDYVMNYFASATKTVGGTPVVSERTVLYEAPHKPFKAMKLLSPFVVLGLLAALVALFSFRQYKRAKMTTGLDYLIYGFTGFMGIVLAWLAIYSKHPAMAPNYNLLWACPVNLLFALILMVKKWRPKLRYYHVLMSAWLMLFVACSAFIPQKFHPAFYLIVAMVLCRSVFHSLLIYRERKSV